MHYSYIWTGSVRFILVIFLMLTSYPFSTARAEEIAFVVDATANEGDADTEDGICATALGACTLRAAIEEANAQAADDADATKTFAITFADDVARNTFCLDQALTINSDIAITGASSNDTVLDAGNGSNGSDCSPSDNRIMTVGTDRTLGLSYLTLRGGKATQLGGGVLVRSYGSLTLERVTIEDNQVTGDMTTFGGGIYTAKNVTLTLNQTTIDDNLVSNTEASKTSAGGGGIFTSAANTITITNSTIASNTVAGPVASLVGGGIYVSDSAELSITNSTISNNTLTGGNGTTGEGAGLWMDGTSIVYLDHATITQNTIAANSADGGGLYVSPADFTCDVASGTPSCTFRVTTPAVTSSIISGNTFTDLADVLVGRECYGTVYSYGYNFIPADPEDCTLSQGEAGAANTDITDKSHAELNMADLTDNGGPTRTHALGAGSAAIDTGSLIAIDGLGVISTDQRGALRGEKSDIGAFEADGLEDCNDGLDNDGDGNDDTTDSECLPADPEPTTQDDPPADDNGDTPAEVEPTAAEPTVDAPEGDSGADPAISPTVCDLDGDGIEEQGDVNGKDCGNDDCSCSFGNMRRPPLAGRMVVILTPLLAMMAMRWRVARSLLTL